MRIGYTRVSKKDQNLSLQLDALKKEGCEIIYSEKASGRKADRPQYLDMLSKLRKGDTLIVYSLDRLGRTSKELISLLYEFKENGINFKSIVEGVFDTTTPMGEAIFQIIAILKSMEVEVLRERTKAGVAAARQRGNSPGRPKGTYDKEKAAAVAHLYTKGIPISDILKSIKISRSTLYDYLDVEGVKKKGSI